MVRVFLIEPVVGVYAFSMFMLYPLIQQYVYRRLWQQLTGAPYPTQMNYTHCSDSSINVSSIHQEIQKEASLFLFYSELCFLFPSLLSSLLLVSYSDHRGRKVALVPPLLGELLFAVCYATVSHLSLSLGYLLGASFLAGVMGGPTALLGGSFAYIADLCEDGRVHLAVHHGSRTTPDQPGIHSVGTAGDCGETLAHRLIFITIIIITDTFWVSKLGGMSIFILYELNAPLCWSEVLVGYGSALSTLIYLGSFAGVSLLSRCLRDGYIVLLGLLSVAAGLLMAAFAKSTLLMFLGETEGVRLPLLLSIMPAPVLRSMMSKIVLSSEQGAVFACVAFVEMLSIGVGITVFSSTYASTVSWFPGFSFLLASAIALIPAVLIGVVMCLRLDKDEEASRLTADDEEEETESCGQSLQLPH
ncbi:solute carrier family 46 member 3 [Salvelinus namaycush]|uniref:Solute carrier family 46 member 3 n=1 Tax=Salvelinus namaycush TaxID=8040 RepID=A0A8U0P9D4_SALNM|nr:solute carrier family 46 member 3 [Salvelinus namaycush]